MSETTHCRRCGTTFTSDTAQGLCPACLLEQGLGPPGPPPADETQAMPHAGYGGYAGASQSGFGTGGHPFGTPFGTEEPSLAEVGRLFPQLEVIELLGRGGMGIVYKARQRGLDRMVALKVLPPGVDRDPGFQERFVREARALARLSHPNIVAVHDFGQVEGRYYFLMEYVDGANLRRMLQAGQLSPAEALGIVPQLCDALQFAHEEGIVHRDVKPENILVDRKGRVKIADFGLAKIVGGTAAQRGYTLTESRVSLGTPHYMAPEQFERPATVDHRADIFSLGVVFYEMLTGELPLGRFPPPSRKVQVDVRLDEVVLRTLEKEPQQRYQHASQVKTDVASVSSMQPRAAGQGPREWGPPPAPHDAPPPGWSAAGAAPAARPPLPPEAGPRRLSRAAVFGAIWAAGPLLAALFFYSLRMEAPGPVGPPGAPPHFEEPPLVFKVFQALAFLTAALAMTAPIGTTVLGVVAIGHIRQSRGRVYGLPLALTDALLFPLLLLDALIFALWFSLMDPRGPEMEIRILILGAITSLAADAWIIRQAWRRVARPLSPSAPEGYEARDSRRTAPGRYQLGPRRSAMPWALFWIIAVAVALLFAGCFLPYVQQRMPAAVAVRGQGGTVVADLSGGQERPDEQHFRFDAHGPDNCKAVFWIEYQRSDERVLGDSFGKEQWVVPPPGEPFVGSVELVLRPRGVAAPDIPRRMTAELRVQSNVGSASTTSVLEDPFAGMNVRDSTWGTWTGSWQALPGRALTLLALRGGREQLLGPPGTTDLAHPADAEIRLMARFDPLTREESAAGPKIISNAAVAPPPPPGRTSASQSGNATTTTEQKTTAVAPPAAPGHGLPESPAVPVPAIPPPDPSRRKNPTRPENPRVPEVPVPHLPGPSGGSSAAPASPSGPPSPGNEEVLPTGPVVPPPETR